jgi:hypothetical protein
MAHQRHLKPKKVLRLPELEQSKHIVLNSLAAASSQESFVMRSRNSLAVLFGARPGIQSNSRARVWVLLEAKNLVASNIKIRLGRSVASLL